MDFYTRRASAFPVLPALPTLPPLPRPRFTTSPTTVAPTLAPTETPTVLDRIKYTQTGIVTEQLAAALLEIPKVVVAKSVSSDDSGNFSDVWGNNCVLAYTALGDINQETPSYGYTYTMEGHPMVEPAYWDANTKSWVYPATYERAAVIAAPMGAFLFPTPA